jgi:hypothetical protein
MLIVAHRFAPAPTLTPFTYTQLIWMIGQASSFLAIGRRPKPLLAQGLLAFAVSIWCCATSERVTLWVTDRVTI